MILSRRALALGALILACGLWTSASGAQAPIPTEDGLRQAFNKEQKVWSQVRKGELEAKDHTKTLDAVAAYYVLRVRTLEARDPNAMKKIVDSFDGELMYFIKSSKAELHVYLGKALIARFKDVFALDFTSEHLAQINAALMLPSLGRVNSDEVGDYLAQLVADPKVHDAIKVHALRGLRENLQLFPPRIITEDTDLTDKKVLDRKKRDLERIKILADFIGRTWDTKQIDADAVRYLRREAIQTLAQMQVAAVSMPRKKGQLEGPVAYTLAGILGKNKLAPAPGFMEKCEAALGLCQLKTKGLPEYDPSQACYLVGRFMIEFVNEYKRDWANFAGTAKKRPPFFPWKILAERGRLAMQDLVAHCKDTPAAAAAQKLQGACDGVFQAIANKYGAVDSTLDLETCVRGLAAVKAAKLYKNVNGFDVDPGE